MMYLSQEVTSKDQELKTQMAVPFQDDETKNSEKVSQESGSFDDRQSDLTIPKASFPENTLCYTLCFITLRNKLTIEHLEYVSSIVPLEVIAKTESNISKQKPSTISVLLISEKSTSENKERDCDHQHQ